MSAGRVDPVAELEAMEANQGATSPVRGSPAGGRPEWPSLAPEALHGLAGEIVAALDPHTESDPVGVLVQLLVAFGNALNRGPHFRAEADYHALNLFAVLVGATSKGRKGTSWGHVKRLFERVDGAWAKSRLQSGLSSGEGLIWAVRDAISKGELPKAKQNESPGEAGQFVVDPGVEDKRLLIIEPEFASVLRLLGREGSTLSATIRQAWDTGEFRILTKNSPAKATGAHVSIIGHSAPGELRRYLTETEAGNGFGNRFLWLLVTRSKELPDGGSFEQVDVAPFVQALHAALTFGRTVGELRRDSAASRIWHGVYGDLSAGKPGLLGAMIGRAEAQVMRLACIYAVLDRSREVRADHLLAALALWTYAEDSARFIFGESLGDPVADEILRLLRFSPAGVTRTELHRLFARNRSAAEIGRALAALDELRLARMVIDGSTGGRPAERWYASGGQDERNEVNEQSPPPAGISSSNSFSSSSGEDQ